MKIAPLYHALKKENWAEPIIVHTGQHYDLNMSEVFFRDLGLPRPDIHLGVGSGTHAEQTGKAMIAYEKVLLERRPDLVVVVGDVNSTMAATIAAVKLGVKVAHLEAGLRSFDRTMPEEINRLATDVLADYLWTPSEDADENLIREGIAKEKIHRVGNIMIDSFEMLRSRIEADDAVARLALGEEKEFALVTLHRPSNVDDSQALSALCRTLNQISQGIQLVFPVHPRTRKNIETFGLMQTLGNGGRVHLRDPLNYVSFMNLVLNCRFALTDSGGIQEETSYLGIPCLTLRPNTERPITIQLGTNRLCSLGNLNGQIQAVLARPERATCRIPLWDGRTAERVTALVKAQCHQ
jgi:UDP-N-acetylglucosamine 2-epimerase (non-hydrolysing)